MNLKLVAILAGLACSFSAAMAIEDAGYAEKGAFLYTDPNLSLGGGLKGEIVAPKKEVKGVFALTPHDPKLCYKGTFQVKDGKKTFEFSGLPTAKYDLVICFEDEIYEGITLSRFKNTLTPADIKSINAIIMKSEPFFDKKIIHRLSGVTGKMTGKAKAVVGMFSSYEYAYGWGVKGKKRVTYKVFYLEDVGPGWQVMKNREVFPTWLLAMQKSNYRPYLSSIRVTDTIKDVGKLDLGVPGKEQSLPDPADEIDPASSINVE